MIPLGKKILVLPDPVREITASGLILPGLSTNSQKTRSGKVISSSVKEVKEGERVIYPPKAGKPVQIDGVDHLVMEVNQDRCEIYAIV
jgi:co-chaperonin GroES (HSP10)